MPHCTCRCLEVYICHLHFYDEKNSLHYTARGGISSPFFLLEMKPLKFLTPETSPGQKSLTTEVKENQLSPNDGGEIRFLFWFPPSFYLINNHELCQGMTVSGCCVSMYCNLFVYNQIAWKCIHFFMSYHSF